jgi:hypothetical protein
MSSKTTRREFVKAAAFTGISFYMVNPAWAKDSKSPNERVNFACIGVGGKGDSDTADANRLGNVVAICDVDENTMNGAAQKYPNAQKFSDYRKCWTRSARALTRSRSVLPIIIIPTQRRWRWRKG